jgi:hypothetical protein
MKRAFAKNRAHPQPNEEKPARGRDTFRALAASRNHQDSVLPRLSMTKS